MTRYFNMKTAQGVETVDQLDTHDFSTRSEFRRELNRLTQEYRLAGMAVYVSERPTKLWREGK